MQYVAILVEGGTEREFVKGILFPDFIRKDIYLNPISMGGSISMESIVRQARPLLKTFDYVTTLCDFYGFQGKYGKEVDQLENEIERQVQNHDNFLAYIQMHEFEALLFSDPEILAKYLNMNERLPEIKKVLATHDNNPEAINDSPQTAPSKRIKRWARFYNKVYHGRLIAEEIGLEKIRKKCPRFNHWICRLESISRNKATAIGRNA